MCAFLRSQKGSDDLKNKVFMQKTAEQKRQYLSAALRYISGGALDDGMIGRILPKISIQEQYTIVAISAYPAFQKAIARAQIGKVRTSTIFLRNKGGAVVVVITPMKSADASIVRRLILIHAPQQNMRKGCTYGQARQRTHSL